MVAHYARFPDVSLNAAANSGTLCRKAVALLRILQAPSGGENLGLVLQEVKLGRIEAKEERGASTYQW